MLVFLVQKFFFFKYLFVFGGVESSWLCGPSCGEQGLLTAVASPVAEQGGTLRSSGFGGSGPPAL